MNQPHPPAAGSERKRGCGCGKMLLGCSFVILLVVTLMAVSLFVMVRMWNSTPREWEETWQRIQQIDPELRAQRAQQLENYFINQMSAQFEPDERGQRIKAIHMSVEDINLWIAYRSEAWLANQDVKLPDEVGDVLLSVRDGQPVVMAHINAPGFNQVVSAQLRVRQTADERMNLQLGQVHSGRLPLPISTLLSMAEVEGLQNIGEGDFQLDSLREGVTFDPVIETAKIHRRLINWQLDEDNVILVFEELSDNEQEK